MFPKHKIEKNARGDRYISYCDLIIIHCIYVSKDHIAPHKYVSLHPENLKIILCGGKISHP